MTTANVHQAKTNLSKLLNAAAEGDDVIITRRGGKVQRFRLVPIQHSTGGSTQEARIKHMQAVLKKYHIRSQDIADAEKAIVEMDVISKQKQEHDET